jgi:hypothetical protein
VTEAGRVVMELSWKLGGRSVMTQTLVAPTLAALVDDLVIYLRDQHKLQETTPPHPLPPEGLERVFNAFGHHLVALALVARSDDKVAIQEREVILLHPRSVGGPRNDGGGGAGWKNISAISCRR